MIRACLSIAVSRPEGNLPALPGSVTAARGVAAWAHAAGFDRVETVTDEAADEGPGTAVSVARLRLALMKMIGGQGPGVNNTAVDHLVIHFAGHAFHDEFDNPLLLLTRWLSDPAEAIDLRRFVRLLEFFSVRRLSLMIDACRSGKPASALDLLGSGVLCFAAQERLAADRRDVPEDRFRAARAGRDAFTIRDRSGGPAHSLFTAILLKTLHGDYPEAIETRGAARAVTSAGIYRARSKHLPAAAASYRLAVEPGLTPGFGPPADVYNLLPAAFAAPELPAPKRLQAKDVLAHGALFGRFFDPSVRSRSNVPARPLWARDDERPRLFRDRQGIAPGIVQGIMQGIVIVDTEPAAPRRIVVSPPARMSFLAAEILNINTERRWSRSAQSYEFHRAGRGRPSRMPASFLIEMDDDLWAGAAAWPGVAIAISRAPLIREVAAPKGPRLIYGPAASGAYEEIFEGCELVLSELSTGLLAYRQAAYIAGLVWHFKQRFAHVNPLLGAVAAYLYDAAGDRDGIRRLASVYPEHGQPVPFDIALLAGVTGRRGRDGAIRIDLPALPARAPRTDEEASAFVDVRRFGLFDARLAVRDAVVAGGFPWLRSGWRVLDLAGFPVHAEVVSLAAHIGPSLFTTLDRTAGRRLAALIERGEV